MRSALVTFKRRPAGLLEETVGGGTLFRYLADWREDIACALPAAEREHRWSSGLHPFFEHLGPEGWLRGRQARAGNVGTEDDLGLLLHYGADCIGAVGVVGEDGSPEPVSAVREEGAEAAAVVAGRTLSGVQKKLLAYRREDAFLPSLRPEDPSSHIAKFNHPDERTLVQNEELTLRLAREVLGQLEVTFASLGKVRGIEEVALLVERFDRVEGELLRLEDFAQILAKPRGRDFRGKYDSSYEEAADVVRRHSARARIDLQRFFKLVLFNLAAGNADAHLKNFSLLERPEGLRLSPAYDLVNTLVYPQFDGETALAIGGRVRPIATVDAALVRRFGKEIGLPEAAVELALGELRRALEAAPSLRLPANVAADDFRSRYVEVVRRNQERIFR